MQIVTEEPNNFKLELRKRTSSANFNSKKIKPILTNRQICDEIIHKTKQIQLPQMISSKTLNYHKKGKSHLESINNQQSQKKSQNRALIQLIKPVKYEKTKQENLLLKYCDKSKLIYWNKDLQLNGKEKYLLISADLIIDQDVFWDKNSFDNSQLNNNNNFASVTHNYTVMSRNRNANPPLPPKNIPSLNNNGLNLQQPKKNPLFNPNKISLFIRQWKKIHSNFDSNNRKFVILWIIRKQSTYHHLIEFSQTYQLPLHGIFYVKRRRQNPLFDLGLIIKEIHQKFFETIVNPPNMEKQRQRKHKSIQNNKKSLDFSKPKSKQLKKFINNEKQQVSIELKNDFKIISNKAIKSLKSANLQQNDQNRSDTLNVQTCKVFQLSKNIKKPLVSIVIDEGKRVRKIFKKISQDSLQKKRPVTVKLQQNVQKIEFCQEKLISKMYIVPLIRNTNQTFEHETSEQDLLQQIIQEKYGNNQKPKYIKPEIYLFEGLKCNLKNKADTQTYDGKFPLTFGYHEDRFARLKEKMIKYDIEIEQRTKEVKMFYFRYQNLKQTMFETINSAVREVVKEESNFSQVLEVQQFLSQKLNRILSDFTQKSKQKQQKLQETIESYDEITLSEEQQEEIYQKTQKKLEQIKKQLINDIITMKGRNYTFENGESIYYYVGGVFKRNYKLLFDQYYQKFQKQIKLEICPKLKLIQQNKNHQNHRTQLTHQKASSQIKLKKPKLSPVQFFHLNI